MAPSCRRALFAVPGMVAYLACMFTGRPATALSSLTGPPMREFTFPAAPPAPPPAAGAAPCSVARFFSSWISSAFRGISLSGMRSQ